MLTAKQSLMSLSGSCLILACLGIARWVPAQSLPWDAMEPQELAAAAEELSNASAGPDLMQVLRLSGALVKAPQVLAGDEAWSARRHLAVLVGRRILDDPQRITSLGLDDWAALTAALADVIPYSARYDWAVKLHEALSPGAAGDARASQALAGILQNVMGGHGDVVAKWVRRGGWEAWGGGGLSWLAQQLDRQPGKACRQARVRLAEELTNRYIAGGDGAIGQIEGPSWSRLALCLRADLTRPQRGLWVESLGGHFDRCDAAVLGDGSYVHLLDALRLIVDPKCADRAAALLVRCDAWKQWDTPQLSMLAYIMTKLRSEHSEAKARLGRHVLERVAADPVGRVRAEGLDVYQWLTMVYLLANAMTPRERAQWARCMEQAMFSDVEGLEWGLDHDGGYFARSDEMAMTLADRVFPMPLLSEDFPFQQVQRIGPRTWLRLSASVAVKLQPEQKARWCAYLREHFVGTGGNSSGYAIAALGILGDPRAATTAAAWIAASQDWREWNDLELLYLVRAVGSGAGQDPGDDVAAARRAMAEHMVDGILPWPDRARRIGLPCWGQLAKELSADLDEPLARRWASRLCAVFAGNVDALTQLASADADLLADALEALREPGLAQRVRQRQGPYCWRRWACGQQSLAGQMWEQELCLLLRRVAAVEPPRRRAMWRQGLERLDCGPAQLSPQALRDVDWLLDQLGAEGLRGADVMQDLGRVVFETAADGQAVAHEGLARGAGMCAVQWGVEAAQNGRMALAGGMWALALRAEPSAADWLFDDYLPEAQESIEPGQLLTAMRSLVEHLDDKGGQVAARLLYQIACLHYRQGQMEECLSAMDRARELGGANFPWRLWDQTLRVVCLNELGRHDEAMGILGDLSSRQGTTEELARVEFLTGWTCHEMGKEHDAVSCFRIVTQRYPATNFGPQAQQMVKLLDQP